MEAVEVKGESGRAPGSRRKEKNQRASRQTQESDLTYPQAIGSERYLRKVLETETALSFCLECTGYMEWTRVSELF